MTSVRWEARQRVGDAGDRRFARCSPNSDAQCRQLNEVIAPFVAANARGDVVALWQRWEGDAYRLASARQLPSGGWTTAASVAADADVSNHKLALDGRGAALALWDQRPNGTRSSRATPAGSWSAPEPIGGVPGDPQLAVEPDGTAHLLFTRTREGLFAIRRAPGAAWSAPVLVRPQGPGYEPYIAEAHLALQPGGDPVALWLERFSGFTPWNEVWSSRAAGGRWTEPARAARFEGETVPLSLQLAATGGGTVAFYRLLERRTDSYDISRVVEQHDAGTAWTAPTPLDTPLAPSLLWRAEDPVAAADASGAFTVAWTEWFYPGPSDARYRVLARRYTPSGGWSPPTTVEDARAYLRDSYGIRLAASAAGDAILLWVTHGPPFTLRASAFVPGRGWTAPETLTAPDRLTDVSVAMDARGNGVVAWAEPEGDRATVFSVRLAAETAPAGR